MHIPDFNGLRCSYQNGGNVFTLIYAKSTVDLL